MDINALSLVARIMDLLWPWRKTRRNNLFFPPGFYLWILIFTISGWVFHISGKKWAPLVSYICFSGLVTKWKAWLKVLICSLLNQLLNPKLVTVTLIGQPWVIWTISVFVLNKSILSPLVLPFNKRDTALLRSGRRYVSTTLSKSAFY